MKEVLTKYNSWLNDKYFDKETKEELETIKDDIKEIEERFYTDLRFGTGGLRGLLGAGTNRMNKYIVRKATKGLANYLNHNIKEMKSVVIAYDCRYKSKEFAKECASVFAASNIKTYVFESLRPTPELSFAVRHLKCTAGIVITASHNPKEYNGYKVYGSDGGQAPLDMSNEIIGEIDKIIDITCINVIPYDTAVKSGEVEIIGEAIDKAYMDALKTITINKELIKEKGKAFSLVYTPIHGSGNMPVRRILKEVGFENVMVVKEQELPDPAFSTVVYPNPEEKEVFTLAVGLAKSNHVDLIMGTDPDSDRIGIMVKDQTGEYIPLTGNQTGCLLLEYMLSQKQERNELSDNAFACTTIVTTNLAESIAKAYNVELVKVLTGFKFIGEKIKLLDDTGEKKYIFGFEESYGYLAGTDVRDKDAVVTAMLIAEMALYYNDKGITLFEALNSIFKKYGYYKEDLTSFTLKGKEGTEKIKAAIESLRNEEISKMGDYNIKYINDYEMQTRKCIETSEKTKLTLPASNVLKYELDNDMWFCVRPSGTEPKIKLYYGVKADSNEKAVEILNEIKALVTEKLQKLL